MKRMLAAGLGVLLTVAWYGVAAGDQPPGLAKWIEELRDPNVKARLKPAEALGTYGAAARDAIPGLMKLVRLETNYPPSHAATQALARIGRAAVPELVGALKHPLAVVRFRAAWALGLIGPDAAQAMPALIKALGDGDRQVRQLSAYALGEMGPKAAAAVVPLVGLLRDPAAPVRKQAATSLQRIGPAAVPALAEALKAKQPATREAAAHALGLLGRDAKGAVAALAEAARDQHVGTRIQAISALGGIGPEAKKAAPALFEALKVKHVDTQAHAAAALLAIGAGTDKELAATMRQISREVRWAKPPVLAQFGRRPKDAVRPLIMSLKDEDPNQRAAAAVALGNIGRDAREAVPALKKALKDADLRVRLSAAGALPQIDDASHKAAVQAFDEAFTQLVIRHNALRPLIQARQARLRVQLAHPNQAVRQAALQAALADAVLQSYYNEVAGIFVIAMSTPPPSGCAACLDKFQEQARDEFVTLGPAAIPSLVQTVNLVGNRQIGFI
jgi:HEAT repeat protein